MPVADSDLQIPRFRTESRDGSGGENILRFIGRDACTDVLELGARRAVDLNPPSGAAVATVPLPDVALPRDAEDRVVVLLVEDDLRYDPDVALAVDVQMLEEILAVVGRVRVLCGWVDSDLWCAGLSCMEISLAAVGNALEDDFITNTTECEKTMYLSVMTIYNTK